MDDKEYYSELLGATVYPNKKIIFFYGGIFSQWADCRFHSHLVGEDVNCAEQAMMLFKAKVFNDHEAYEHIKNTDHPRNQKAIGRMIKNFDVQQWEAVALGAVTKINFDKFSQNSTWGELLLMTDPYELVEASPTDNIWGIGMSEYNPNILERDRWGRNLLGKAISQARSDIINKL